MEERITAMVRWNALAWWCAPIERTVSSGGTSQLRVGGDFVGFNHFFRGSVNGGLGDLVYFQAHSAPGIYASCFYGRRLSESQLGHYRQEVSGQGLCSYPIPG